MPVTPNADSCGAPANAETIYDGLLQGESFPLPTINLDDIKFQIPEATIINPPEPLDISKLTSKQVDGTGYFDIIMSTVKVHLDEQYRSNRIAGKEYSEAYIAQTQAALSAGVQILMNKDQMYWQAILAQAQARQAEINVIQARVELEKTKLEFAQQQIMLNTVKADFAAKKMQLAILDAQYCNLLQDKRNLGLQGDKLAYENINILPKQLDQITKQITGLDTENQKSSYELINMLPAQLGLLTKQGLGLDKDNIGKGIQNDKMTFELAQILPKQATNLTNQGLQIVAQTSNVTKDTEIKAYTLTNMMPKQNLILAEGLTEAVLKNDILTYTKTQMLPLQKAQLDYQNKGIVLDNNTKVYSLRYILPKQAALLSEQIQLTDAQEKKMEADGAQTRWTTSYILPEQRWLIREQREVQRAQTRNVRSDGIKIVGLIGKQKDLYTQQITSYQRDAEVKAAKLFTDAFAILRNTNENTEVPGNFSKSSINTVLTKIRSRNGFWS